jgi:2-dehydropantoate 2-reductase
MSAATSNPKVAVAGAGAVGGYFGGLLSRAGKSVLMIGRPPFVDAVKKSGLYLDTVQFQETVRPEASSELSAAAGADLVLFCVKTRDTASVAKQLSTILSPQATIVSLQNGVNNAEDIRAASGREALSAVVYVAAAVPEAGRIKHFGRGDLVLGPKNEKTEWLAGFFRSANIPCRISDNIKGELWTKLIWNCALNAISGLGRVTYGEILASEDAKRLVEAAVYEVLDVARAKGIHPPGLEDPKAALAGSLKIAEQMSGMRSSTAQDMARGKYTEIDALNGYVAKLGDELGVPTPVNHTLYTLVKLQEAGFGAQAAAVVS